MDAFISVCLLPGATVLFILILISIRIVKEWQEGIKLRLGRYVGNVGPGIAIVIPIIEQLIVVDKRITTVDIPKQEVMTKDNVPVKVNAVVYMRVVDPKKTVLNVSNYVYAVANYAQTALRDVIGEIELDNLLANREVVAEKIESIVDKEIKEWGLDIISIKLQDVELPQTMKRAMARQAEAEREKRATIILSQGEVIAAKNLQNAAEQLKNSKIALHLRTLETISDISGDPNAKVIFLLPYDVLEAFTKKK